MKNLRLFQILILVFVFTACSTDTENIQNPAEDYGIQKSNNQETENNDGDTQTRSGDPDPIPNEHGLAWAAYIAGKVLYDSSNTSERNYFNTNHSSQSSVDFEDLLGSNPVHLGFKSKFISVLTDFVTYGSAEGKGTCPGGDNGNPGEPVLTGGEGDIPPSTQVQFFLDWLVDENCAELYFPDGLDLSTNKVTTLSHPLTTASSNEGIVREPDLLCEVKTTLVTVDATYITSSLANPNVMVARFEKLLGSINCSYSNFPDFTIFLQGPF